MNNEFARNPFIEYQPSILMAAANIYRAERDNVEPDPEISRVNIMPRAIGGDSVEGFAMSEDVLDRAKYAEAQVNVAARSVARLALLQDTIDSGGVMGFAARLESRMTKIMERKYTKDAVASDLIDTVRGK